MRAIISGGGTGGHIFPALSIADKLREKNPDAQILFIGAEGRMEMEKVPAAGYDIKGLPVSGLKRKLSLGNLAVPFKALHSYFKAAGIIRSFKPDVVIGVGGYASAPTLWAAALRGIPCLIQEQNSFAGLTNRSLGRLVRKICVAYGGMERFFPKDKIVFTGNPIRGGFGPASDAVKKEGLEFYGLDPHKKHILIIGGSLGCRTLNESVKEWIEAGCPQGEDIELLWQCGQYYKEDTDKFLKGKTLPRVHCLPFISRMDLAYAAADLVISRSGASSISELCVCRKATIFVPSPNVAEDHQTANAMSLVNKGAAAIVRDSEARQCLMSRAIALAADDRARAVMENNIASLAVTDAADRIVKEIYGLLPDGGKDRAGKAGDERKMGENGVREAYFIGIGGIGMSAIARYFKSKGVKVSGYDRTPSPLTKELEKEGMEIHYDDDPTKVPAVKEGVTVVYTPAVPEDMAELKFVKEAGYKVVKRSRMLGEISTGMHTLAISGTHGKTTTSTLLGHIFQNSGIGCNAFLGGISKNYGTNLLLAGNDILVAEADEFDRSFLQLHPEIAVITAMDADHLDIYGDIGHVHEAFKAFASQTSGTLIVKAGLPISGKDTPARLLTYSFDNPEADFHAASIRYAEDGHCRFDLVHPAGVIKDIRPGIPGWVNVENSVAAAATALAFGVNESGIKAAIENYMGVKRRFDVQLNNDKVVYIDDYAHHPEELATAIGSIRRMFPGKRLTAVFQPHLYTRTRDLAEDFAKSLSAVDRLILLDIYPAREEPIEGVSSKLIFDKVTAPEKTMASKENLKEVIGKDLDGVLVTFGAGDIDRLVGPIREMLIEE